MADSKGEFGDVVSRVLPHGIYDTSKDTQVRETVSEVRSLATLQEPSLSPRVKIGVYLNFSLFVVGAWGTRFLGEPTNLNPLRRTYLKKTVS